MSQLLENLGNLGFAENSLAADFYCSHLPEFAEIKGKANYLEQLFLLSESLGEQYAGNKIDRMNIQREDGEEIRRRVIKRDFGAVVVNKQNYDTALQLRRETEQVKRRMIFQEVSGSGESTVLSPVERILILGSIILSEYSDEIYFAQWLPEIKDSEIGKALKELDDRNKGAAANILPGKVDGIRWFTRRFKNPTQPLSKDNIELVPYRESLQGVSKMVATLDGMVELLQGEMQEGRDDYGYLQFLRSWSECLKGNGDQKQLEDQMMVAWRQIEPDTPVFIVPWAEYGYGDPGGVAIAPSLRIGVKSTSEETTRLTVEDEQLKIVILDFISRKNISGKEMVEKSKTIHRFWTGFAGLDVIIAMVSQVLPNDQNLRAQYGGFVLPNMEQHKIGDEMRREAAIRGYPAEIEKRLSELIFSTEESATIETGAHEYFHGAGVIQKGEDHLGKLASSFEEAKSTIGGMLAQVKYRNDAEFSQRAAASLIYPIPRYLTRDGSVTHQGYANIARVVATVAEKVGILKFDPKTKTVELDIDTPGKIDQFWLMMETFVDKCFYAYVKAAEAGEENVQQVQTEVSREMDNWFGIKSKAEDGKVTDIPLIDMIKAYYRNS